MAIQLNVKNPSLRNTLKITQHDAVRDEKNGNKIVPNKWKKGAHKFLPPNQSTDIWLDSGLGIFIEEMPT
jgi:hypothetical protein